MSRGRKRRHSGSTQRDWDRGAPEHQQGRRRPRDGVLIPGPDGGVRAYRGRDDVVDDVGQAVELDPEDEQP